MPYAQRVFAVPKHNLFLNWEWLRMLPVNIKFLPVVPAGQSRKGRDGVVQSN
jgi:hypothetical protein